MMFGCCVDFDGLFVWRYECGGFGCLWGLI